MWQNRARVAAADAPAGGRIFAPGGRTGPGGYGVASRGLNARRTIGDPKAAEGFFAAAREALRMDEDNEELRAARQRIVMEQLNDMPSNRDHIRRNGSMALARAGTGRQLPLMRIPTYANVPSSGGGFGRLPSGGSRLSRGTQGTFDGSEKSGGTTGQARPALEINGSLDSADEGSFHDLDLDAAELDALYGYRRTKPHPGSPLAGRRGLLGGVQRTAQNLGVTFKQQSTKKDLLGKHRQEAKKREGAEPSGEEEKMRRNAVLKRFQKAGKRVVITSKFVAATRNMDYWDTTYQSETADGKWWNQPLRANTSLVRTLQSMCMFFCIMDIMVMCIEGVAFADWLASGGDFSELTPGFQYVYKSLQPEGSRTHQDWRFFNFKLVLGLTADVWYMLDILSRFRLIDNRHGGLSTHEISRNYFRRGFFIDLFASFPVYWVFIPIPWVRLNRLVRIGRNWRDQDETLVFLSSTSHINIQVLRVTSFMVWITLWVHVLGSLTSIIVFQTEAREDAHAWMSVEAEGFLDHWRHVYLRGCLFAWSQITNGQGDMSPQTEIHMLWTLLNQVVGSFIYMVVLGKIVSILQNIDLNAVQFNSHRDMVSTFMRLRDVPIKLRMRVNSYFDALWDRKRGMDEHEILASLPPFLRHDLSWSINRHFLQKVPMFYGADAPALMIINQFLSHVVVTQNEFLMRAGEVVHCMYFVISGELSIFDDEGKSIAELYEGSVVGEIGILLNRPAQCDVKAQTTCDLFRLTRADFETITNVFPSFRSKLIRRAEKLYGDDWLEWVQEAEKREQAFEMTAREMGREGFSSNQGDAEAQERALHTAAFEETFRSVRPDFYSDASDVLGGAAGHAPLSPEDGGEKGVGAGEERVITHDLPSASERSTGAGVERVPSGYNSAKKTSSDAKGIDGTDSPLLFHWKDGAKQQAVNSASVAARKSLASITPMHRLRKSSSPSRGCARSGSSPVSANSCSHVVVIEERLKRMEEAALERHNELKQEVWQMRQELQGSLAAIMRSLSSGSSTPLGSVSGYPVLKPRPPSVPSNSPGTPNKGRSMGLVGRADRGVGGVESNNLKDEDLRGSSTTRVSSAGVKHRPSHLEPVIPGVQSTSPHTHSGEGGLWGGLSRAETSPNVPHTDWDDQARSRDVDDDGWEEVFDHRSSCGETRLPLDL